MMRFNDVKFWRSLAKKRRRKGRLDTAHRCELIADAIVEGQGQVKLHGYTEDQEKELKPGKYYIYYTYFSMPSFLSWGGYDSTWVWAEWNGSVWTLPNGEQINEEDVIKIRE